MRIWKDLDKPQSNVKKWDAAEQGQGKVLLLHKRNQLHKHGIDLVVTNSSAEKDLPDLVGRILNIRQ